MAVVTHHPVVVHLKGVAVGGLAVDVDLVALPCQVVELVGVNDALLKRYSVDIQLHCNSFLRNIQRPEVVYIPRIEVGTVGEKAGAGAFAWGLHVAHHGGDVGQFD